jgi:hypothetical protein
LGKIASWRSSWRTTNGKFCSPAYTSGWPGDATAELATALGFADVSGFYAECRRLAGVLSDRSELSSVDAVRALLATEIAFASDVFGAGVEWETVTGLSDEDAIAVLPRLQRKLVGMNASVPRP